MANHGGARPGAGGPPKPPLTRQELGHAINRAADLNGGRVNARGILDAINEARTRGYVDQRTIDRLKVSTTWLRQQRKTLKESSLAQRNGLETRAAEAVVYGHPNSTTPMNTIGHPNEASDNNDELMNVPETEAKSPAHKQVDSERLPEPFCPEPCQHVSCGSVRIRLANQAGRDD